MSTLKSDFAKKTSEAESLRLSLEKAEEMVAAARNLLDKLGGEKGRWLGQVRRGWRGRRGWWLGQVRGGGGGGGGGGYAHLLGGDAGHLHVHAGSAAGGKGRRRGGGGEAGGRGNHSHLWNCYNACPPPLPIRI